MPRKLLLIWCLLSAYLIIPESKAQISFEHYATKETIYYTPGDTLRLANYKINLVPPPLYLGQDIGIGDWPIIPPPYNPWSPFDYYFNYPIVTFFITGACGDTYSEKGKLLSRCACEDSVLHGKSIYWDETGHKYAEYTYDRGHLIKSKSYDGLGRISGVHHYNRNGDNHGLSITYDYLNGKKTTQHYVHGMLDGSRSVTDIHTGQVLESSLYEKNQEIEYTRYHQNGQVSERGTYYFETLTSLRFYHRNGQLTQFDSVSNEGQKVSSQLWDTNGVTIRHFIYENGLLHGEQLQDYNPENGDKVVATYFKNQLIEQKHFKGTQLVSLYENNLETKKQVSIHFFDNGDTSSVSRSSEFSTRERTYDINQRLLSDYTHNGSNQLVGCGFYYLNDTLYTYSATETPTYFEPIKRWVIYQGDTLREEYLVNNYSRLKHYQNPEIIWRNYYTNNTVFGDLKTGIWVDYSGSHIQSAEEYSRIDCVQHIYYAQDTVNNHLNQTMYWTDGSGQKQGCELVIQYDGISVNKYQNNQLSGACSTYTTDGKLLSVTHYENNQQSGISIRYDEHGYLSSKLMYQENQLHGWCEYYHEGRLVESGEMEHGVRKGVWTSYVYLPNGQIQSTKIRYRKTDQLQA